MVLKPIIFAALGLVIAGCAATPPERRAGPVHPEAAALSDLLRHTGRNNPARIDAADAEMAALRAALSQDRAPVDGVAEPVDPGAQEARMNVAPGPAPDLSGARSLLSAVHLASYRHAEHAAPGWAELKSRFPNTLAGSQPRLARADLGEQGVFLRLKAGPFDSPAAAQAICDRLAAAGAWCAPTAFTGEGLNVEP